MSALHHSRRIWPLAVAAVCLGVSSPARSDLWVTLKSGEVLTVPVDPKDVDSIEFGQGASESAVKTILDRLGDNEGAWLPPVGTAGEGRDRVPNSATYGPGVRDYSRKLVYSRSLERAFYVGANHGSPHRFNDVWSYDLERNLWTLLYHPDFDASRLNRHLAEDLRRLCVVKAGIVQTTRGGPCYPVHTWWGVTFDEAAGELLWMNATMMKTERPPGAPDEPVLNDRLAPLWAFDVRARTWRLVVTSGPRPPVIQGGALINVPETGKTIWFCNDWNGSGMWAYDGAGANWSDLAPNGLSKGYHSTAWPSPETITACSPDYRAILAIGSSRGTAYLYEFATNKWRQIRDFGPKQNPNSIFLAYDSVNKVFLKWEGDRIRVYHYGSDRWETLTPKGDRYEGPLAGYFDPARNVLVGYTGKRMYVYRYRKPDP